MSELIDSLTGLSTSLILRERVNWLLARRRDDQRPFGLLQLDVSNFAKVNGAYGVSVGDSVLVMAADRMLNCMRPSDMVGRLGNDDFQLVCSDGMNTIADLKASVDRLVAAVNAEYDLAGLGISIHFKAAALFIEAPYPKPEQIYRRADECLVAAKCDSRIVIEAF